MKTDEVLSKVKALLSKTSDRGATEAEQEAAISKAQELLIKYNLSLSDVKADDDSPQTEDVTKQEEYFTDPHFTGPWRGTLLGRCAEMHFCKTIYMSGRSGCHVAGTPANIAIATELWKYLIHEINLACMAAYQEAWWDETPHKFQKQFVWGAVHRLAERMKEARRQAETQKPDWYKGENYANDCRAMVLAQTNAVEAFFKREWPHVHYSNSRIQSRGAGYEYGRKAADGMRLGRQSRIGGGRVLIGGSR